METRVLYPGRLKLLLCLAGCIGFTAVGAWMISDGTRLGWAVASIFGLGIAVFAAMLLPGSCSLRIGPDGFEVRSLFRSWSYRWSQVGDFGVCRVGGVAGQKMVVFNFADDDGGGRAWRRLAVAVCGWEGGLPSDYGMPAEALAELLNRYRQAAADA